MKIRRFLLILWILLSLVIINGCGDSSTKAGNIVDGYTVAGDIALEQVQLPEVGEEIAVMTTNKGVIKMRLFH